ncbi:MAG TPA: hypothetical protein VIL49_06405, partial [Capillimicrobium sp.]
CVLNDVAVAVDALRADGRARRFLVLDLDAHPGEGTAELLAGDADALTVSLHARSKGPARRTVAADLDVELPGGTGDDAYLSALGAALGDALAGAPFDLAFLLAGADAWEGDRLGRLGLTKAGLRRRDEAALGRLRSSGAPVCVLLAGGYAPDIADTVEINAATARALVRSRGGYPPGP